MVTQIRHPYWYNGNYLLWFVAFSRLQACFCARNVPYSVAWPVSAVLPSRTPFKYFHAFTVNLQNCLLFHSCSFASRTPGLCSAFPAFPRLPSRLQVLLHSCPGMFLYVRFASQTLCLCSALPSSHFSCPLCYIQYCLRTRAYLINIRSVQCCSLGSLKSYALLSFVLFSTVFVQVALPRKCLSCEALFLYLRRNYYTFVFLDYTIQ